MLLSDAEIKKLPFHNLEHTKEVVQHVKYLCEAMDINSVDTELLIIAAWFHDTGFSKTYKGHEAESKLIATTFLKEQNANKSFIDEVCNCIDATRMPQSPTDRLSEILCDADIYHISTPHFFYRKLLLRREWEVFCDIKTTNKEWHLLNQKFLQEHHFRSEYGEQTLEIGKQENIHKVENILTYFNE
ncbi:HD domain-containing protein [Nonlabens xiamenensis]|uniref:HD domain-containing protein n=1 Tax=Nonlabens xiamenensis TaxID=2341043 RepID=UPI0013DE59AF|nr:HD domain-containing protein [Nonlabens xiamenensis]